MATFYDPLPPTGETTQQSWDVWVKIGFNGHADFIEDITIYDCSDKPGYVRGTVIVNDLLAKAIT